MAQKSDCGNNSENLTTSRFSIVAYCSKAVAKSAVVAALLSSSFYFAWIEPASRAPFVQMTGVVVTTLLKKDK